MRMFRAVRDFPLALRLLFINQFGVDIGFCVLIPFLAKYLEQDLGMSAALVGLVLAVRNLSQQGLFVVGGTAADRLGARTVIVTGCALRTAGFALFAFGNSLPLLLAASVLSSLAGALFYPAVRAYVAQEMGERQAEAFALLNVFATSGWLIGLLLGSLLFLADIRVCALAVSGFFTLLTIAQALTLPARKTVHAPETVLADWREVLGNRRFLCFSLAATGMVVMENQLFVLLPEGARTVSGWNGAAGLLLASGAVVHLLFQLPITRTLERRGGGARWLGAGIALIGAGFVPPLLVCATTRPDGPGQGIARLAVMITGALLLYAGGMIAYPSAMEVIPRFGRERLTGTYFGLFYMLSGTAAVGGNAVVGWAMDLADCTGRRWLPWLCCVGFGLTSAVAVNWLYRARVLPRAPAAVPRPAIEGPARLPGPAHAPDEAREQPPR
ncbi:MFS transporter [Streptomyces olivoreticuli]|uniref:MFS transporter n=1 Tax=Streptomyces TaxID=1883 RepID=UPI00265B7203|nr:MFS transporter [Streptomyces olivoreticuli]WKK23556.1 MFS transporter [Streptomyces olivoreticuli]